MISKTKKKCKVDGCSSLLFGKGFCSFHYKMEKVNELYYPKLKNQTDEQNKPLTMKDNKFEWNSVKY